jgi:UrcA family protein
MKLPLIFTVAITLASAAQAASAGNDIVVVQDAPTARVSYADLNLASAVGRGRLAVRIKSAARMLCSEAAIDPLDVKQLRSRCYHVAMVSGANQMSRIAQLP